MGVVLNCVDRKSNIERLHQLNEILKLNDMSIEPSTNERHMELTMTKGRAFLTGLYKTENIAVVRSFVTGGSVMERHRHEQTENLTVVYGCMQVAIDGEEMREIGPTEHIRIDPGVPHKVVFPVNTEVIGSLMPGTDDFPNGR